MGQPYRAAFRRPAFKSAQHAELNDWSVVVVVVEEKTKWMEKARRKVFFF